MPMRFSPRKYTPYNIVIQVLRRSLARGCIHSPVKRRHYGISLVQNNGVDRRPGNITTPPTMESLNLEDSGSHTEIPGNAFLTPHNHYFYCNTRIHFTRQKVARNAEAVGECIPTREPIHLRTRPSLSLDNVIPSTSRLYQSKNVLSEKFEKLEYRKKLARRRQTLTISL